MPAPYASKPSVSSFTSRSCALCTCRTYVQPSRLHHPRLSLHPTMHLRPTTQCTLLRTGTLRTTPVDCCSTHLRSTNTHSRTKRSYSGAALVPKTKPVDVLVVVGAGSFTWADPAGFNWVVLKMSEEGSVGASSVARVELELDLARGLERRR